MIGGTDSTRRFENTHELWCARNTDEVSDSSPKASAIKALTILIALTMFFTLLPNSGVEDQTASTAAITNPFSTPVVVNDIKTNDQSLPVMAVMPNIGLLVAWQDARSGNEDIYTSRSLDNGTTFSASRRADDSIVSSKQIEPSITMAGNGTVFLVWQDNRRSTYDYDVYLTKSYDGGLTFTKNVKVDDSNGIISWQERPSIAVSSGGTVYVAWSDDRTGIPRVRGAYSTDGGATFSTSEEIASAGGVSGQAGVTLVPNGNRLFAAFMDNVTGTSHPYLSISTNGGKSFAAPVRIDGVGNLSVKQRDVSIAPMPGGGIVAAWEDFRNGHWDIYASILSARGTVIRSDFQVDDDPAGAPQNQPSVVSDQLGNIYAAWTDGKDGAASSVRVAFMPAGNASFNTSMEVSKPGPLDFQRSPAIKVTAPGRVIIVWQDDKSGTYEICFSSAYFPYLFGLSLTGGWNMISIPSEGYTYMASTLGLKNGDIVTEWNSTRQVYSKMYIVGVSPPSADFAIVPGVGYWVNTGSHERMNLKGNIPTSKQSKHISVPSGGGWAAVGFESLNTSRYASDIPNMLNVTGGVSKVAAYDSVTGVYSTYLVGVPPSDFLLAPGQAYWCFFNVNVTLSYTP